MMRRISLSPRSLQEIRDRYPNDFTFHVQRVAYSCPSFIAELLSPGIRHLRTQDPTIDEIRLDIADPSGFFGDVISIGFGEGFELDAHSARLTFLRGAFSELWNSELFEMTFPNGSGIDRESVIDRIKFLEGTGQSYDNEAAFVAKHFYDFPDSDLEDLSVSVVDQILGDPDLIVESEERLFDFLRHLIESDPSYFRLLEHLRFQFLSLSAMKRFMELVSSSFSQLTIGIWERVGARLSVGLSSPASGPRFSWFELHSQIISSFPAHFHFFAKKAFHFLYRGSRHGFDSSAFHSHCDGYGDTVTIILTDNGCIFGGYSPCVWGSATGYVADSRLASFLFTIKNVHNLPPRVFKLMYSDKAICTNPDNGPCFGGGADLSIGSPCTDSENSWSNFGHDYENRTGIEGGRLLAGSYRFTVREIEVFRVSPRP
jgi:hypothetical protein